VVTDIITQCYGNIDKKQISCLLLLDNKKAFDFVNHSILLDKLHHSGVRGIANDLFKSYLSGQSQYLEMYDNKSLQLAVLNCVPQGSILGLIIFLLYINDLPNSLQSIPRFFADDTCLLLSNSSITNLEL